MIYVWFLIQMCTIAYYQEFIYAPLAKFRLSGMCIFLSLYLEYLCSFSLILIRQNKVNDAFTSFGVLFFMLKFVLDIIALIIYYKTDTELKFIIVSIYVDIFVDLFMFMSCVILFEKDFSEMPYYFFNYDTKKLVS